ncbi:hypothetical protein DY000_02013588 [Brassica cretica]|uniref:Uncharacterized protein n=1 Tax=Brassica cretica TaxID=69181 RepID=A0ABQ7CNI6_BRACR|nr:hypothetical protein DY000_02013588 [Brassica cretica]
MASSLIDEARNQKAAYRAIASRLDQAEQELAEHRANARERNQPPPDPLRETLNPQNVRAFGTPEIPSARSGRYTGENSQRPPQQSMPQRSLSYSGLDEIDTGLQAQRSTLIQSQNRYMERTGEPRNRIPPLGNLTSENQTPSAPRTAQQTGFSEPRGQARGYDPRIPIDADPQREDLGILGKTGTAEEEEVNYIGGAGFQGNQGGNRNSYGNRRRLLASGEGRESARRRLRGRKFDEFRWVTLVSIDTSHRASIDIHQSKSIDRNTRASIDNTYGVNRILQCLTSIDTQKLISIDNHHLLSIDRGAPITYRVQMPKIDLARLNALRPKPKPSEQPPKPVRTLSDDGDDPMEEDRVSTGRTLRRRKEKVRKHLKRGANEKEKENFQKRVFRIPLHKPFEEAYYSHILWMFFRETREKEEDIRRMFCEAREKMRKRITLKKKSDPGQSAIPCTVEPSQELFTFVDCSKKNSGGIVTDLEVKIGGNALVPVDFHILDIKLNWNSSLLLGRAFLSTVGAVCNL